MNQQPQTQDPVGRQDPATSYPGPRDQPAPTDSSQTTRPPDDPPRPGQRSGGSVESPSVRPRPTERAPLRQA